MALFVIFKHLPNLMPLMMLFCFYVFNQRIISLFPKVQSLPFLKLYLKTRQCYVSNFFNYDDISQTIFSIEKTVKDCSTEFMGNIHMETIASKNMIMTSHEKIDCKVVSIGIQSDILAEEYLKLRYPQCSFFGIDSKLTDAFQKYKTLLKGIVIQKTLKDNYVFGKKIENYLPDILKQKFDHQHLDYVFFDLNKADIRFISSLIENAEIHPLICQLNVIVDTQFLIKNLRNMKFFRYTMFVFSWFLLLIFSFVVIYNPADEKFVEIVYPIYNKTKPLIVFCTQMYGKRFLTARILSSLKTCKYQCDISENFWDYHNADIAIFHLRDMVMNNFFKHNQNYDRLNVFYSIEVTPHETFLRKLFPKQFFNVSMSFRRDSTIWKPADRFEKLLHHEKENIDLSWNKNQINNAVAKKSKLAVQFVSHCETHSLREILTEKLRNYANITVLGECYKKKVNDEQKLLEKHFFYLAFENAVCKDYITEKFWRLKQLIVPVVLKREILKGIVDDEYFIAVDDFNSPKELTDYLISLSKNLTAYKKYLRWTLKYKKTSAVDEREFCQLCEMAHTKQKHTINNIQQWWKNGECTFNYFNFTLQDVL